MSYSESPIIITGCARSGTSLTAGIINLCGAFGGVMRKPNINNKKGMFENIHITQNLVKPFLRTLHADPMGQNPLPDPVKTGMLARIDHARWHDEVRVAMINEGHKSTMQWFYKGAKVCLMWQVWALAFPTARWIIVRRKKEDIIKSCLRTSFMRAYDTEEGWSSWVDFHVERFNDMKKQLKVTEIQSEKIVQGDLNEIKALVIDLGLSYNDDKIKEFVSPELWNQERK